MRHVPQAHPASLEPSLHQPRQPHAVPADQPSCWQHTTASLNMVWDILMPASETVSYAFRAKRLLGRCQRLIQPGLNILV